MEYRELTPLEVSKLKEQGCHSTDWQLVKVADEFDISKIYHVGFDGEVHIGNNVRLDSVGIIRTTDGATFGEDVLISVKNEAGDGNVVIFCGLTSQLASLMISLQEEQSKDGREKEVFAKIRQMITKHVGEHRPSCTTIGDNVTITNCRELTNVNIGAECELAGASRLIDCTLSPTPEASIYIGDDVIMENVVAQAGATIIDGAKVYDTFVGEACHIGRGFTSEASLFFANSYMDNGESCAALCGPFTVSHHKSSLLIGGEYSFYNAGSGTNFSNHAYKMGPMHYGTMERGAKTASSAHILWPAQIGAFSMAMNKIQSHPDTSLLPFSYVIGDGRKTNVVPGKNLCTVGTYRDVTKWPKRDARPVSGRKSLVNFDWLSPYVIERVKAGIELLQQMQDEQGIDADIYKGDGYTISRKALEQGLEYYDLALRMYGNASATSEWTDLLGLLAPTEAVEQIKEDILNDDITKLEILEEHFKDIFDSYEQWKGYSDNDSEMEVARKEWLAAIRQDAEKEYDMGDVSEDTLVEFLEKVK